MEQKYQAVLAVIRDGLTIVEVANRFGVSRQFGLSNVFRTRDGGHQAVFLFSD